MFDLFDDDMSGSLFFLILKKNKGTIDFREFLSCLSFLMRGKIKDKLEMSFYIFDKTHKHYLTYDEFIKLIESLIKTTNIAIDKVMQ